MSADFWLGLAALPAALGTAWLAWKAYAVLDKALGLVFKRVPLGKATNRAAFAAAAASARRVHVLRLFGIDFAVVVGFDPADAERIYKAVLAALRSAPAPTSERWRRQTEKEEADA